MVKAVVGVIGGSGVYDLPGLEITREEQISTPWGAPSDALRFGRINTVDVVFLPRHGRGHVHSPSGINYRANIDALKRIGVTDIISLSAVGSLREDLSPGTFVIVDQFIDRTFAREKSFFGKGLVAHVSMAHPVCSRLGDHLAASAKASALNIVRGGTYLVMEGPQFSSQAESLLYRQWKCDVIGMTNMPFRGPEDFRDVYAKNHFANKRAKGFSDIEITEELRKTSRDNSRTPMQWSSESQAGFTSGHPWIEVNPNYVEINVEAQLVQENSVLNFYKKLADLRRQHRVFIYGYYELLAPESPDVYAYSRSLENEKAWIICNLKKRTAHIEIPDIDPGSDLVLYNSRHVKPFRKITLHPYECRIYLRR